MLTEDEFGQALGVRMRAELEDLEPVPGLAATVRRRQARRQLAVRVATSGAAAVAVVATIGVVHAGTAGEPGGGAATRPGGGTTSSAGAGTGGMQDVAYVRTQMLDALANSKYYILHSTWTSPGGSRIEEFSDRSTGQFRRDGFDQKGHSYSRTETAPDAKGNVTDLFVYYHDRIWTSSTRRTEKPPSKFPTPVVDLSDPASVRQAIESGTLQLIGKEQKDGRATLHVRLKWTTNGTGAFTTVDDIWVDQKSFLVYSITSNVENKPTQVTYIKYDWLPRTAANLDRLEVTPPPGFQRYGN